MDWDAKRKETAKKEAENRNYLLSLTDSEAQKLPSDQWYQRIRYLREIEAFHWLQDIKRRNVTVQESVKEVQGDKKERKWHDR